MSENVIGPPILKDFLCEIKGNKSPIEHFDTPTVHLHLNIDNNSKSPETSNTTISMELDPNALNVLLDGLHRIQNQLANVAQKQSRT